MQSIDCLAMRVPKGSDGEMTTRVILMCHCGIELLVCYVPCMLLWMPADTLILYLAVSFITLNLIFATVNREFE